MTTRSSLLLVAALVALISLPPRWLPPLLLPVVVVIQRYGAGLGWAIPGANPTAAVTRIVDANSTTRRPLR